MTDNGRSRTVKVRKSIMLIVHDKRLPEEYVEALKGKFPSAVLYAFDPGLDQYIGRVYESILCHPDIYLFQLDGSTLIHAPCLGDAVKKRLRDSGAVLIEGHKDPCGRYPGTVPYNAARVGKYVFHNRCQADEVLAEKVIENGLEWVDVPQGYSRCSVLGLGENAIITSDGSIAVQAADRGIEVLVISTDSISLPGEEHGFIGGASGRTSSGDIIFLGDIRMHSDFEKIRDFLVKFSCKYIMLDNMPLLDAGSLLILG